MLHYFKGGKKKKNASSKGQAGLFAVENFLKGSCCLGRSECCSWRAALRAPCCGCTVFPICKAGEAAHVESLCRHDWLLSKDKFQDCDLRLSVGSWRLSLAAGLLTGSRGDFPPPCSSPVEFLAVNLKRPDRLWLPRRSFTKRCLCNRGGQNELYECVYRMVCVCACVCTPPPLAVCVVVKRTQRPVLHSPPGTRHRCWDACLCKVRKCQCWHDDEGSLWELSPMCAASSPPAAQPPLLQTLARLFPPWLLLCHSPPQSACLATAGASERSIR